MLQVEDPGVSTGSTEPKTLFTAANQMLGLRAPVGSTKPQLARHIVESAGFIWRPTYESRGSTITRTGLTAVRHALRFLLEREGAISGRYRTRE